MRIRRAIQAGAFVAAAASMTLAGSASAVTSNYNKTVTSGSSSYAPAGVSCSHPYGTIKVTQTGSNPTAAGRYRLRNTANSAVTESKDATNGGSITWTGMVNGNHELQLRRAYPADTNGISFGSGNTTLSGQYTCP